MKVLVALLILVSGLFAVVSPASADEYTMANRPVLAFPGRHEPIIHQTPYPQSWRSSSIFANDACERDCTASCTVKMKACTSSVDADSCRPYLDACDRSCQRSCRSVWAKPILDFVDW